MSRAEPSRAEWVDIAKFICIMFVMMAHLESNTEVMHRFYESFFLTVFFFVSGYVYHPRSTFKAHFTNKVKRLFVPWFLFSNLNILLSILISLKSERDFTSEFVLNMLQIRGVGDGMWFVAALFVAYIPFYFFAKCKKPQLACLLSFALSLGSSLYTLLMPGDKFPWGTPALPWHLEYIFDAVFWMLLGYYFKLYGETFFNKYNTTRNKILLWTCYLILVYAPYHIENVYLNIPLNYVKAVLGTLAIVSLCKSVKTNRFVSFVGANTLIYFALHGKAYAIIEMILRKVFTGFYNTCLGNVGLSTILSIAITLVLSICLLIPAVVINRWLPWMLGRSHKPKVQTAR